MSNLDKDIEILKEIQGIFEHFKNHGWVNDLKREVDIDKVIPAISRIIDYVNYAELTKIACCTAQNCEALNNAIRLGKELENKDKELEMYKKIAEKLAEQVKREVVFYDTKGISSCDLSEEKYCKYSKHNNGATCKQCIIDWARKEVENENNK